MSRVPSSAVRAVVTSLLLTGVLCAGAAYAATDIGSINFILGRKSLTNDWNLGPATADTTSRVGQPTLGVELTWGRAGWPAAIALDILHSYDDGITREPLTFFQPAYDRRLRARTIEIGLGARRSWNVWGWSPYLGAGGSWVRGTIEVEIIDPSAGQFGAQTAYAHSRASALGYWAGGGLYRRIGPRFQIGLAGRYSKATLETTELVVDQGTLPPTTTLPVELDGGGRHVNLVVGWSFPGRK